MRKSTLELTFGLIVAAAACAAGPMDAPDLFPVAMKEAPNHVPVELVRDGKPLAVVVMTDPAPSAALKTMLAELVEAVKLSTGAELTVVTEPPDGNQAAIVIGDCEASRAAGIDAATLPIEGFEVKTAANRVFLVGSTARLPSNRGTSDLFGNDGTAWAVSDFLERFVGVRWYWPVNFAGRTVVNTSGLTVPPAHYSDAPVFRKRSHFPGEYGGNLWQSRWTEKRQPEPPALGNGIEKADMRTLLTGLRGGNSWPYLIKVHEPQGFRWHRSPEWFAENAAMFQVNRDGGRSKEVFCYSSQAAYDFLMQGAATAWDDGKPGPSWITELCFSISPGDEMVVCHCEPCRKLFNPQAPQYGAVRGEASAVMGQFVKKVCEEVARRWPDKKVIYLPYWNYALCPEDIAFPDNLEIEFCTTGAGGLREAYVREGLDRQIRLWSEKAGGPITTWEYSCWITTWTHAPFQYPNALQSYYRANREHLAGSFINGGSFTEWNKTAPTLYVWMRLLWNPEINVAATLDEMCRRLFGPGAETSRKLLQLMIDRWETAPWSERLGASGHLSPVIFNETWPPEVVAEMEALYRQAREEMKDAPVELARFDFWNWTFEAFLREAGERRHAYAVPRLNGVAIDGKADDWSDAGLRVDHLTSVSGTAATEAGFSPSFRLAWDEHGLLVLAKVLAADFKEAEDDALDSGDCIELYLAPKVGESDPPKNSQPDLVHVVVSPGMDPARPELRMGIHDLRQNAALKAVAPRAEAVRAKIDGGYLLEARIAWDALGIEARPGAGAAFQFYAVSRQDDGKPFHAVWYPERVKFEWHGEMPASPFSMYSLRLVE
jgi:hypothetical protein